MRPPSFDVHALRSWAGGTTSIPPATDFRNRFLVVRGSRAAACACERHPAGVSDDDVVERVLELMNGADVYYGGLEDVLEQTRARERGLRTLAQSGPAGSGSGSRHRSPDHHPDDPETLPSRLLASACWRANADEVYG
jgi:hypothetical protein